jgi:hypothetical protein
VDLWMPFDEQFKVLGHPGSAPDRQRKGRSSIRYLDHCTLDWRLLVRDDLSRYAARRARMLSARQGGNVPIAPLPNQPAANGSKR